MKIIFASLFLALSVPAIAADAPPKVTNLPIIQVVNGQDYGVTSLWVGGDGSVEGIVCGPHIQATEFKLASGSTELKLSSCNVTGLLRRLGEDGGHEYGVTGSVDPGDDAAIVDLDGGPNQPPVVDLGRVGVAAAALVPGKHLVYAVRGSDGHLLRADLAAGTIKDLGETSDSLPFQPDKRRLPTAIAVMPDGTAYTSGKDGALLRVAPDAAKAEATGAFLPFVPGREAWANADALFAAPDGTLYGGTGDGYVFHYDPKTNVITNLGKPLRQSGIEVLLWGPDGNLHGVGGQQDGMPHFFEYRPASRDFLLGNIPGLDSRSPGAPISAGVFDTQGRLVLGQSERLASLLLYPPGMDK